MLLRTVVKQNSKFRLFKHKNTECAFSMEHLILPELREAVKAPNLELNEKVKSMQKDGCEVYHLAFGQSPFPIPISFVNALKEFASSGEYLPVAGTLELRRAIAKLHHNHGEIILPEQIVVGTGSKELIFHFINIFNGDVILVSPGWTTYAPQVRLAKQKCFVLQTSMEDQWKVSSEMLESFINEHSDIAENRLLILNNPGNPSGMVYTSKELKELTEVFRKLNVVVLSDEIYGLLNFKNEHESMAKYYPEGTVLTSGFSKWCSAGGWRVGYIVVPKNMNAMMSVLKSAASSTYSCAPAPMQHALAKSLDHEELGTFIEMERKILKAVGDYCYKQLKSVGVQGIASEGGYYFMPDFEVCRKGFAKKGIYTGKQMCTVMLKDIQVALLPGSDFLMPESDFSVRLCFIDFDGKIAMDLLQSAACVNELELGDEFVEEVAPRVVEGIKRLKEFALNYT